MARYTITPWRYPADLLQVRQQLYRQSEDGEDRRRYAAERVMAWKLRGNLPHAVESTALLIDAQLHHSNANSHTSAFSIRAVYSAAFCRFVTGFCDIGRHKDRSLDPKSMLEIAREIDMPAEFVGLRHEATHEELPNVARLVKATREALHWLWRVYWSRLAEPEDSPPSEQALAGVRDDARKMLKVYRRARRAELAQQPAPAPASRSTVIDTADSLVTLCNNQPTKLEAVADVLVKERLIVPAAKLIGSPMDGAFLMYDDFLLSFCSSQRRFFPVFVSTLLHGLGGESEHADDDATCEALHAWLSHVLFGVAWRTTREVCDLSSLAVRYCCLHPGSWTAKLGEQILAHNDRDFAAVWKALLEASRLCEVPEEHESAVLERSAGDFSKNSLGPDGFSTSVEKVLDSVRRAGGWTKALTSPTTAIGILS